MHLKNCVRYKLSALQTTCEPQTSWKKTNVAPCTSTLKCSASHRYFSCKDDSVPQGLSMCVLLCMLIGHVLNCLFFYWLSIRFLALFLQALFSQPQPCHSLKLGKLWKAQVKQVITPSSSCVPLQLVPVVFCLHLSASPIISIQFVKILQCYKKRFAPFLMD